MRIIDQETSLAGDRPFEFEVDKDNNDYNQRRYEALGEVSSPRKLRNYG